MTRTQVIVFDMEGVLIDSQELHAHAKRSAFARALSKSRVIEGKQDRTGVVTSVVDGFWYLQELHTSNAKFILQNGIEGSK